MNEIKLGNNPEVSEGMAESIRLIQREIEKIVSPEIKDFTYRVFAEVDPKFWISPASSTGKYHPAEDNGEGGLVRHVIKADAVLEQSLRRSMSSQRQIDIGRCAILLHDTCKNGVVWESQYTDYTHGKIAAEWLEKFDLADTATKNEIISAVRYHMGQWSFAVSPYEDRLYTKQEMNDNLNEITRAMHPSVIEQAVQDADYWSSRQSMSFFPGIAVDLNSK